MIRKLPVALLFLSVAALAAGREKQFITAPEYKVGNSPYSVLVSDLNQDGRLDLVVAHSGGFSVLLGNGDGSFQSPLETIANIGFAAIGDFNLDGKPDLAAPDAYSGVVKIYLGNGDGSFQPPIETSADHPGALAVGDLNQDGIPDLVAGVWATYDGTRAVSVLLGTGNGHFGAPVEYQVGGRNVWVQIGDANRDGKLDVIAAGRGPKGRSTISTLLGNGSGSFAAAIDSPIDAKIYAATAADLNGDGILDVAVVNPDSNSLGIAFGNGDGTFKPLKLTQTGMKPESVIAADFNADGKTDLATSDVSENAVSIHLGNGDGTFRPRLDYTTGTLPYSAAAGDFNGDGKLDLVVTATQTKTREVAILLGNGNGTFYTSREYPTGYSNYGIAAGDFNGDGRQDLVVGLFSNVAFAEVFLTDRNGALSPPRTVDTQENAYQVAVGDLNGDGKLDIVTSNFVFHHELSVVLGNGDGTFQPHMDFTAPMYGDNLLLADFNNDGKLDVAMLGLGYGVAVLLGNGDGTLGPAVARSEDISRGGQMAVGDVNGDGNMDLVVGQQRSVTVMLGKGDGTFGPRLNTRMRHAISGLALADLNEDGKLDVAVMTLRLAKGDAQVLLGNGDGTFHLGRSYPAGLYPDFSITGDFNRDGHQDVVVTSPYTSIVRVFFGKGDGTLYQPQEYAVGVTNARLTAADVNQDGFLDLAVSSSGYSWESGTISVLLNKGVTPVK